MHLKSSIKFQGLAYILTSALFFALCSCTESQPIKIAIMGDQTGAHNLDSAYSIMAEAAHMMEKHTPDILIHVGDMTESKVSDSSEFASDFNTAAGIMNSVGVPWYLTAGDHDVNPAGYAPQSTDRSNEERFRALCVDAGFPMSDRMYYSIDFQGYHLVFLYSLENLHSDPRWGSIFLNGISEKQLQWLQSDLEAHKDAEGIIVVTHHPHWYSWSNWYPVHNVLRDYPVAAVIGGHFHYDQVDGMIDGINYMVVGATGGSIKSADPESGGSHQYALLTLSGSEISNYEIHEVYSDSLLEQTSRRSMDRIQSISSSMSNIYGDEKLIYRNGLMMSTGESGKEMVRRHIDIESIANPIDLPVKLSISGIGSHLESPHWIGYSGVKEEQNSILLGPGERCGWANYSSVGQWYTPSPIWAANIINVTSDSSGGAPVIGVSIKMEYEDTKPRWIASKIIFPIY